MNIVMVTNTYIPHVGGVARSVAAFSAEYRRRGHRVLVVAPEFADMPRDAKEPLGSLIDTNRHYIVIFKRFLDFMEPYWK